MKVDVLNIKGQKVSQIDLVDSIFNVESNDHAIYLDVKQYLANQRQGTHQTKEKSQVSGSTRKLKKQKGTGTARAGSIKSGVFVGGARIFGPRPRNYSIKINKKVKDLARRSALTHKLKDKSLIVIEDFSFDAPKTKAYLELLKGLKVIDNKTLLVVADLNKNVYLSSRNISNASISLAKDLNTYDILKCKNIILTVNSIKAIESNLN